MPVPYSTDLRWRVVWMYLIGYSFQSISDLLQLSARSVSRYVNIFLQTGEVKSKMYRHGSLKLLGEFEQVILPEVILRNPGI